MPSLEIFQAFKFQPLNCWMLVQVLVYVFGVRKSNFQWMVIEISKHSEIETKFIFDSLYL